MGRLTQIGVVLVSLLPLSCAPSRVQRRPYLITENLDNAARHSDRGEKEEAAQIYQVVLLADPQNEKAKAALAAIGTYDESVVAPSLLGKNKVRAPRRDSRALWFVMYPVNRLLDILDVVTLYVGPEGGVYANAHVTHAMQAGLGAGGGMELGWWQKRELALGAAHVAGLALGPFEIQGEGHSRVGTRGAAHQMCSVVGINRPSDFQYQAYRDYWGIGGRAIAAVVGVGAELHPVELADALAGFFFIDFLRDDIGHTRSLRLNTPDIEAMMDLIGTLSPSELRTRMRGRAIPPPQPRPHKPEQPTGQKPDAP